MRSIIKNILSKTAIFIILTMGIFTMYAIEVRSDSASTELDTTERTHFIVLIRDTGMMKKKHHPLKMIVPTLPKLLFKGAAALGNKRASNPPLPVYRPAHDHLSVVFVAIHRSQTRTPCKTAPALSALPQHLFQWQPVEQKQNQRAFTLALRKWVNKDCRAQGRVSSTVLAQTMILPYVQDKLAEEGHGALQFSRTILVMLDNDAYYGTTIPSTELAELANLENVRDIDKAARIVDKVSSAFHIVTPRDWVFTIHPRTQQFNRGNVRHGNTLRYRLAEIVPLDSKGDNYVDPPLQIRLDRVAISDNELKWASQGGMGTALRILPSERLRPDKLELRFSDKKGQDWFIGSHQLPRSTIIDLNACVSDKKCLQVGGVIYVPLLSVVVADSHLSPDDPVPTFGQIHFKVRFRYNANDVYNHHYIDTKLNTIALQPVQPFVIPESQFFTKAFSEIVLDNKTLAEAYDPEHDQHGLTQTVARARIAAAREAYQKQAFIITISAALALLALILFLFYKFAYQRRFQPRLDWNIAKKIDIDFNQAPGARLLVGTLNFRNEGLIPWFGRWLGNNDYPDYKLEFSLSYNNDQLKDGGLVLSDGVGPPFGFRGVGEGTMLMRQIELRVSHETPIYIFLATDVITDFQARQTVSGPRTVTFGGLEQDFQISLDVWRANNSIYTKEIEFDIELIPEQSKPPRVTYQACPDQLYFAKGKTVSIGTFRFESQAVHRFFACPFVGRFNLRSYKNNLPLANENAIALLAQGENRVVSPAETSEADITVLCDGTDIPNPEPPSQDYAFNLIGEFAPGSTPGSHWFSLYRDPTRADIHLDIVHGRKTYRIHWEQQGDEFAEIPTCRLVKDRVVEAKGQLLNKSRLNLPKPPIIRFDNNTPANGIFDILIGNTGLAGRGWVKIELGLTLNFQPAVRRALLCWGGYNLADAIRVITSDYQGIFQEKETITVKEGEPPENVLVQLDAATIIRDIIGGRVESDYGHLEATLAIEIQDDVGNQRQHKLTIRVPIGLEKLPHQNWLCIDFGTSAIVAAIGTGDRPYFLPLQKIDQAYNPALNFEDYDPNNVERGTDFLPSQVVCDADLRQDEIQDDQIRKGFSSYQPASLKAGDPDFIGLPASTPRLHNYQGRVIYSLKSWLAQPTEMISLSDQVELLDKNNRPVKQNRLPLAKVVESGFSALAEAYITAFPVFEKGGQLVLSHPNTFTAFHRKKLHNLAWRALNQRLGIALPERIRLISESDAVAYHYCRQRMLDNRQRTGLERLLIYDFGAGTLDLSLIHVRWNPEGVYPERWDVENRLGVPVAGNHLDSLLARLVDKCLTDKAFSKTMFEYEYRYPVVARQLRGDEKEQANHRRAVHRLWQEIRQTKHAWDGKQPFRIRVGAKGAAELIYYKGESAFIETVSDNSSELEKPLLEPSDNDFYLTIPSTIVHNYPPLQEFMAFVTQTVVDELLQGAAIPAQDVDTVVISGRGALWPGLRERVWAKFPDACEKPDLKDGNQVKNAVVSGAIAWQNLAKLQEPGKPERKPRLAILREDDRILVPEEEWGKDKAIDLRSTTTFSLVQVSHQAPDPNNDLNSLRRYFYIQLARLRREWKWAGNDKRLFVYKKGSLIRVENAVGDGYDFTGVGSIGLLSVPPWPIGRIVLPPDDLYC